MNRIEAVSRGRNVASGDDAAFLEAEIARASCSRFANDDVIDQLDLQDSASFIDPTSKPHISLRRGWVS